MRSALLVALALSAFGSVHADEPGAAFLTLNPSVRSESMGGTSAYLDGVESLNLNPAFLPDPSTSWRVYSSVSQLGEETRFAHLAMGRSYAGVGWGVSLTHLATDGADSRDASGAITQSDTGSQDTALAGGWGRAWKNGLRAGLTGRAFVSSLGTVQSDPSWALDTGIGWRGKSVSAGFALRNLGPGQKFLDQRDPLPRLAEGVAGYRWGPLLLEGGFRSDLVRGETGWMTGGEYGMGLVSLRAGYVSQALSGGRSADASAIEQVSCGFGLSLPSALQMDYSFRQGPPEWGALHRLSLAWSWGKPSATPKVVPPPKNAPPQARKPVTTQKTPSPKPAPPVSKKLHLK
jgi:hypothetical protein